MSRSMSDAWSWLSVTSKHRSNSRMIKPVPIHGIGRGAALSCWLSRNPSALPILCQCGRRLPQPQISFPVLTSTTDCWYCEAWRWHAFNMRSHSSPIVSTDIFPNMWVLGFFPRNCPATNCGFTKVYLLTTNNTKSETSYTLGSSKHPGRTSNQTRCQKSAVEAVNEVLLIQLKEASLVGKLRTCGENLAGHMKFDGLATQPTNVAMSFGAKTPGIETRFPPEHKGQINRVGHESSPG